MGSGMNRKEAEELASKRTYRWAVNNVVTGKGIAYRKATMIKLRELAEIADRLDNMWIPCEEKLPEADGLYLATFALIGIPKFSNVESFKNGEWEYHNGYIIAWQPLPEPWKREDDE